MTTSNNSANGNGNGNGNTNNATTTFRPCLMGCMEGAPHGYFYNGENMLPITVVSLLGGQHIFSAYPDQFAGQDMAALEQQMKDAGLPEVATSPEVDVAEIDIQRAEMAGDLRSLISAILGGEAEEALDGSPARRLRVRSSRA